MTSRRCKRLLSVGAVVVLLGVVLPNVAYVGHWAIPGLGGAMTVVSGESHNHAGHCHGNSSCASEAGYGLTWSSQGQEPLVLDGNPELERIPEQERSPGQPALPRLDPPPRYA